MKSAILTLTSFLLLTLTPFFVSAQIAVNTAVTAAVMAQTLIGSGITISNVTMNCSNGAFGTFTTGNTNLGMNSGIVLTTGDAVNVVGPNTNPGFTGSSANSNGDADLDQIISPSLTNDACALEFDVQAANDTLVFNYVFGSEEYEEFVTGFNDVFGLFISGPGIVGNRNIALIPSTTSPVSIQNVNCNTNSSYYVCNDTSSVSFGCANCPVNNSSTTVGYDGFTTTLTAIQGVTPFSTYHLKLVVADAVDHALDSGIFIEGYSMKAIGNHASGINDIKLPLDCELFPNPATDVCKLKFNKEGKYTATLYNTFSTKITSYEISNTNEANIDVHNLPAGIYFLKISNTVGESFYKKLLVK